MDLLLDGCLMTDRDAVHDWFAEKLSFPAYYGRNLDALYDLLTAYSEELEITVVHLPEMTSNLGSYASALMDTLWDASRDHQNISLIISNEII